MNPANFLPLIARIVVAWMLLVPFVTQAQDEELLAPEKAFAFVAEVVEGNRIDAKWLIADDYYMYRDKIGFSIESDDVSLGSFDFPVSKSKDDPVFGAVDVYLHEAGFSLPISGAGDFTLVAKGQGCNEPVGVCYPPQTYQLELAATAPTQASIQAVISAEPEPVSSTVFSAGGNPVEELRSLLGGSDEEDELLPAEEAFKLEVEPDEKGGLIARFLVAPGYYLYQKKIKFDSNDAVIAHIALPAGEKTVDEYFGETVVYRVDIDVPISFSSPLSDQQIMLDAAYQGCADIGVCYPPQQSKFTLAMPIVSTAAAATIKPSNVAAPSSAPPEEDDNDHRGLFGILFFAFLAGIGLTFTPCVLPLIPILSSVIAGQGEQITKSKAFWLSLIYVLGTAVTYAVMGAVAGATGAQLQAYFQNIWAIGTMALVFVLMSLAMFGLYEIQMPSFIQSRLQEQSSGLNGGSTPMVFMLGLVSALIVGACVSPVLISFLGVAISRGSPSLGAATMFAMALGMGVPLILLGMGAGHLLPKAGMWMDKVKYVFGVLLLAVAIYLLSVIPSVPVLLLWAALFITVGVYLGATQSLPEGASGWRYLFKGLGTLVLVWGVIALIGGLFGERDILKPLPKNLFSAAPNNALGVSEATHVFNLVKTEAELDAKLSQAVTSGKMVILDFYADWCTDCIKLEQSTFGDPAVVAELQARFMPLQVDVTDPNGAAGNAIKKRYGVFGPPAVLFFDRNGQHVKRSSFYGYQTPTEFLAHLKSL